MADGEEVKPQSTATADILAALADGPMFVAEIAPKIGRPAETTRDALCKMLHGKRPRVQRVKADYPAHLAKPGVNGPQWLYSLAEDTGAEEAPPNIVPPRTPFPVRPLQGCGLFGRPIVLRPGSDRALQTAPYVAMER